MKQIKLHDLLITLNNELNKNQNEDKGKLGILVDKCLSKANLITNTTKNLALKHDYRMALNRLDRHSDPKYKDIDNWARVILNYLIVTFPHRF